MLTSDHQNELWICFLQPLQQRKLPDQLPTAHLQHHHLQNLPQQLDQKIKQYIQNVREKRSKKATKSQSHMQITCVANVVRNALQVTHTSKLTCL